MYDQILEEDIGQISMTQNVEKQEDATNVNANANEANMRMDTIIVANRKIEK